MTLRVYDSRRREKVEFTTLEAGKVKMYVCGVTVYDRCHVGHARSLIFFDTVVRYLRWRGYEVSFVRNITDIDDKIIKRANENGETFEQLTERMIAAMHEDEARLNVLRPDQEPRASQHIDGMFAMIQTLIDKGYAYAPGNGDVYYRVGKFEGYGKLSRRKIEDLKIGARIEVDEAKQDPLDFVLWKAAKPGEPSWTSPWGEGRPGWHIECSAMSRKHLGLTLDIHGGGADLIFPHHENEVAQSEGVNGAGSFARTWVHNGFLTVNGEKMSKSLGNFYTVHELLDEFPGEAIRLALLKTHYRQPLDFTKDGLAEAKRELDGFYGALRGVDASAEAGQETPDIIEAMSDDLNTPLALSHLHELAGDLNKAEGGQKPEAGSRLLSAAWLLGLLGQDPEAWFKGEASEGGLDDATIDALTAERDRTRENKEFKRGDEIRDQLEARGILLEDGAQGTTWKRK